MKHYSLLTSAFLITSLSIKAMSTNEHLFTPTEQVQQVGTRYKATLDSLVQGFTTETPNDLLENPYYYPLFSGTTLHDATLHRQLGSLPNTSPTTDVVQAIDQLLLTTYVEHPQLIAHQQTQQPSTPTAPSITLPTAPPPTAPKKEEVQEEFTDPNSFELFVRKPNFWKLKGNFSLQFMQYHVSDNWYKGGEDHNSLLAGLNFEANYDNKQKLTFNNKLEMKLGFQSSNTDTQHRYKTNADLLRLTNKLGLRAAKHWYYTVMLQSWTQFYPGHKANDPKVHSDFMSPFESVFSVGMDYKLSRKNFEIVATLSPFAANFKYVDRLALSPRYGVDTNKHTLLNFGSTFTINTKWNISKDIQWASRLYYFSSYKRVQAEWENTISLKVNKYLSSKIFLYPRFDDGVKRKDGESFLQFNEYLSVGLDLAF